MSKLYYGTIVCALVINGCASAPPRVLSVKSSPAEANVCINGKFGSELISREQQCIGTTPFEADQVEVVGADGKKRIVHFNQLDQSKEDFYLVVNRKGYSSESANVPSWDHFVILKQETPELPHATITPEVTVPPVALMLPTPAAPVAIIEAKTGAIKITSDPPGALVYINDTVRGNTPFAYESQAGMAKVRIEYPNRQAYEGTMSIVNGESRELNIKLPATKRIPATVIGKNVEPEVDETSEDSENETSDEIVAK